LGQDAGLVEVLSLFIALLELARRGSLRLGQSAPFAPIMIRRELAREAH
jgi:chromatin segregation and condensation protein Rec8/ScpA/Scc1 (kleisin family)